MKYSLNCIDCGKTYTQDSRLHWCECSGKLDVSVNLFDIELDREELLRRDAVGASVLEKYFEFLPLVNRDDLVSLGEGGTRLKRSRRLAKQLGFSNLYLKDETTNPTGSFKDRPIMVGLNKALEFGAKAVATASSGNAATSLAAGAAKAGIPCIAFVPEGIPDSKAAQLKTYGAHVYRVKKAPGEHEDPTVKALRALCALEPLVIPVPSFGPLNPYQLEGAKTMAFEVAEAVEADHIVIPVGGAGLLLGTYKAYGEFKELGLVEKLPKLHAVQPAGCAPLVRAFETGGDIEMWGDIDTVANGIADPFTWDGKQGLDGVRERGGTAIAVEDEAILGARSMLARFEGIFAEPTGSAALAGAIALANDGNIDRESVVVVPVTGSGFKDLDVAQGDFERPPLIDGNETDFQEISQKLK